MASPRIGRSSASSGARARRRSHAIGRLQRAIERQWLVFVITAALIAGAGILYQFVSTPMAAPAIAFWASAGIWVGCSVAAFREMGRHTVTSLASLGRRRDYAVLGAAPELSSRALRELAPDQRTPIGCLAFQPASPFATAFRDLQGTLSNSQIVAFIAARANEGASTAALCTASAAAQQGRRVVLLDCDLRARSFSAALAEAALTGLLEACARPGDWRAFIGLAGETGLHFIANTRQRKPQNSLAETPGFAVLLEHLRGEYDLIVLDCPPVLGADGTSIVRLADTCVVVAAWDETPISSLRASLRLLRVGGRANAGLFVNRVPPGFRFGRLRPD